MGNRASAAEDTRDYREGYPGKLDTPGADLNLRFYGLDITTRPGGDLVTDFHGPKGRRHGDYDWLEIDHSYIQWLFPIREQGLNYQAQELMMAEAEAFRADPVLQGRIIDSYETMLDFYGMQLQDRATGKVVRSSSPYWRARYSNLNLSFHNNLRITRILKCLGEVGLEHMKRPFVEHVLTEVYENEQLVRCRESCMDYWANTLRRQEDRDAVTVFTQALHQEHGAKLGFRPAREVGARRSNDAGDVRRARFDDDRPAAPRRSSSDEDLYGRPAAAGPAAGPAPNRDGPTPAAGADVPGPAPAGADAPGPAPADADAAADGAGSGATA
eukprot:TRINITY_DN664_c0_g1_i1.p2 TRINITY_DN664_c0_g1~~TRINITY_DN664_c0_g1_i1.p2  ORF type:complete len:328 (+),score=99.28 TRINITY_DN664_c0_g1_i1:78-1061(+)